MISFIEALDRLRVGNARFVAMEAGSGREKVSVARRGELLEGQEPFAIILGCSDSRVPAELVFDLGFGDLFVIRVAGNVVASSQVGSVEFAAQWFGTPLVVVMGHSHCGAVTATIEDMVAPNPKSRGLRSIVDRIRPTIEPLMATEPLFPMRDNKGHLYGMQHEALVEKAVRANIRASVEQLRRGSEILESLVQSGKLLIVGAEYSLETGLVDFFYGLPDSV